MCFVNFWRPQIKSSSLLAGWQMFFSLLALFIHISNQITSITEINDDVLDVTDVRQLNLNSINKEKNLCDAYQSSSLLLFSDIHAEQKSVDVDINHHWHNHCIQKTYQALL